MEKKSKEKRESVKVLTRYELAKAQGSLNSMKNFQAKALFAKRQKEPVFIPCRISRMTNDPINKSKWTYKANKTSNTSTILPDGVVDGYAKRCYPELYRFSYDEKYNQGDEKVYDKIKEPKFKKERTNIYSLKTMKDTKDNSTYSLQKSKSLDPKDQVMGNSLGFCKEFELDLKSNSLANKLKNAKVKCRTIGLLAKGLRESFCDGEGNSETSYIDEKSHIGQIDYENQSQGNT